MYDLIIVGLGAVGAASAYQAAKRGAKVLGIDRFAPPHALGSSHGDTRITRIAIGEGEHYTPIVRRSHQIWRDIEAKTGEELLVVTGGLIISSSARRATTHVANFFENTLAAARRFGVEHELLDAGNLRELFPQFNVSDNEVGYYEPGAGYLRPEACIRAELALAEENGAELRRNERVDDIADEGGVVRVRTEAAEYRARQVIVAAGAWLPQLLDADLARHFRVTRQVLYWFETTAPIADFTAPHFPIWIWELQDREHVIYGFPAIGGMEAGIKIATEQYARQAHPDESSRAVTEDETREMRRNLVAPYLPGVGARCIKAVSCLYTATPDFHFAIGRHPRMPNVIVASACSGHGFKHSAAIGEALAQLACEARSTIDLAPFSLERFHA
ncbi:MAG TPA: N-methyl-L-tryptophan oxidase [Usitatibacter sp.]